MRSLQVICPSARFALYLVLAAGLSVSAVQAAPLKPKQISIRYLARVSGVLVGEARLNIAVTNNAYNVAGTAKASGVIKNMVGFKLDVKSYGILSRHAIFPTRYSTKYGTESANRAITINYSNTRNATVSAKPRFYASRSNTPLKPAHFKNTLDPLSSLFLPIKENLSALSPENCNRLVPVFDGRVRYNLKMTSPPTQKPLSRRGRSFKGPILNCRMKMLPVAGYSNIRGKAEQFETRQEMQIWLTPIGSAGLLIPIRGLIPTPYGLAEIIARRVYLNGQKVAAL